MGSSNRSAIGTLVESTTRYLLLCTCRTATARSTSATRSSARSLRCRPAYAIDHVGPGIEMRRHDEFTAASDVPVYFCDPHSPWQRGSNENTKGPVRQYCPKGTDLRVHTAEWLVSVAAELNGRPCKTPAWRTFPATRSTARIGFMSATVATTG